MSGASTTITTTTLQGICLLVLGDLFKSTPSGTATGWGGVGELTVVGIRIVLWFVVEKMLGGIVVIWRLRAVWTSVQPCEKNPGNHSTNFPKKAASSEMLLAAALASHAAVAPKAKHIDATQCVSVSAPVTDVWCVTQCGFTPPNCPSDLCDCEDPAEALKAAPVIRKLPEGPLVVGYMNW